MTTTTNPSPKNYRVKVHGGRDCDNSPTVALFAIDEQTAQVILSLAKLAKDNDLHKLEKFDYRVRFLQYDPETDPEDAKDAGAENEVRTECEVLSVTRNDFFFAAYIKHTDIRVSCEGQSLDELIEHFGLCSKRPFLTIL